jgi:hypothetical protein
MLTELTKSYFAGLFDGEGTIGINHVVRQRRSREKKESYYIIYLSIANRNKTALELAKQLFGGSIYSYKRGGSEKAPMHRWSVATRKAALFLQAIQPYAIIKKEHIQVALDSRCASSNEQREYFRQRLKLLNSKGVIKPNQLAFPPRS